MIGFDDIYLNLSFMFLKDSWRELDKIYGKPFFIYEMQELMKNEKFSTLYFHRLDTIFDGASSEDCEQLIEDIRELARYYHKRVFFSINSKTKLGQILKPILENSVDYEHIIKKFTHTPVNLILSKNTNRRISL